MRLIDKFMLTGKQSRHPIPVAGKILGAYEEFGSLWIHVEMLPSEMTQGYRCADFYVLRAGEAIPGRAEHLTSVVSSDRSVYHVYVQQ